MRQGSTGTDIDDLAQAVGRREATVGRVGAMVQEQGNFLARLLQVLGLVAATRDTRQRLAGSSGRSARWATG